jgi:hypothetical protein
MIYIVIVTIINNFIIVVFLLAAVFSMLTILQLGRRRHHRHHYSLPRYNSVVDFRARFSGSWRGTSVELFAWLWILPTQVSACLTDPGNITSALEVTKCIPISSTTPFINLRMHEISP